jgi:MoxR-like ATPase
MPEHWQLMDDILAGIMKAIAEKKPYSHRLLLYGPPGTGKTHYLYHRFVEILGGNKDLVYMDTAQEDKPADALLGSWLPTKSGVWEFVLGYAPQAFSRGAIIINEIDKASMAYQTECHRIGDDLSIAMIRVPDGRVFVPHDHFLFGATMNGTPEDLPEPLADRFDIKVFIKTPHPDAIAMLSEDLRDLVEKAYSNPEKVDVTMREFLSFDKNRRLIGDERAGKVVFGDQWNDINAAIRLSRGGK